MGATDARKSEVRVKVVGVGGTLREGSTSLGALRRALAAARGSGAAVKLLDLGELDLPMYRPGRKLEEYGPEVRRLVEEIRDADAVILSTAAYHGTLAGVTKNALDFLQFLARDERPYLEGRAVGVISTAGGDLAATNANGALMNAVHALRGTVVPLMVGVPQAWKRSDGAGDITDEGYGGRLDALGRLVAELAQKLRDPAQAEADAGAEDGPEREEVSGAA